MEVCLEKFVKILIVQNQQNFENIKNESFQENAIK